MLSTLRISESLRVELMATADGWVHLGAQVLETWAAGTPVDYSPLPSGPLVADPGQTLRAADGSVWGVVHEASNLDAFRRIFRR